jgi:D-alanyl-D-alanine carboxypeptidase (penicillin-binding protein 5/6)
MEIKKLYSQILGFLVPDKKNLVSFLKVFRNRSRRLNLTLILLFFLIFPNQNPYSELQPLGDKPLIRSVKIDLPKADSIPVPKKPAKPAPYISASSAIIMDLPSKTVMFAKQPNLPLLPASITKIMTALVALEHYQPDQILTVFAEWNEGQVIGFTQGEKLTFTNFLYSMLVGSENDAAEILAQNYPQGYDKFIEAMNKKAEELHLTKTHFVNASGIDVYNQKTTVHDLAVLATEALKNPLFRKIVATKEIKIADISGKNEYLITTTNKLLEDNLGVLGIKTGWTDMAGECLVSYVEKDGRQLVTVVLASQDRFGETKQLINWALTNFSWKSIDTKYQQLPGQNL